MAQSARCVVFIEVEGIPTGGTLLPGAEGFPGVYPGEYPGNPPVILLHCYKCERAATMVQYYVTILLCHIQDRAMQGRERP